MVLGSNVKRVMTAGVLAACVVGTGVVGHAQTASTEPSGAGKPVAVINGHDIDNAKFDQLLMQVSGLRVFEAVLNWTLVQQACDQAGIHTEGEEFTKLWHAEYDRALNELGAQGVPEAERPKALQVALQQRGVSEVEFQMALQQTAGLRALSKGHVTVTDEEVKRQFDAEYGEQVNVRIITVKSLPDAAKVREAIEKDGKDPTEVASEMHVPIQKLTIAKNNDALGEIRDIAFQLNEKQLSAAVMKNNLDFLVYLDKKIPAKTDVKFDSVKDKVKSDVMAFKQTQWMNQHLQSLRQQARITINDPVLGQQFQAMAAQQRAQAAAATQAAKK